MILPAMVFMGVSSKRALHPGRGCQFLFLMRVGGEVCFGKNTCGGRGPWSCRSAVEALVTQQPKVVDTDVDTPKAFTISTTFFVDIP